MTGSSSPRRAVAPVLIALAAASALVVPLAVGQVDASAAESTAGPNVQVGPTIAPAEVFGEPSNIDGGIRDIDAPVDDIIAPIEDIESTDVEGDTTTIVITSDVLFDFDSATLTKEAKDHLKTVADKLKAANGTIDVDGYTDSSGTSGYNKDLSKRRAQAVVDELKRTLPNATFKATGHGESDPVAPNQKDGKDDPEAMAKNRRVTISFK